MPRLALYFVLFIIHSALVYAGCQEPDWEDPDEFFDNLGKTSFCQELDRNEIERNSRGSLGTGLMSFDGGNTAEGARAVASGNMGTVFVAGRSHNGANNDFLVFKFFADGALDTSFDTDGKVFHSFGDGDDWPHAMVLQTNGAVLVAGRSNHGGSAGAFDFAVLRMLSTGSLDTAFDTDGKKWVDITGSADIARGMALQTNGNIVLAGYGKNTNMDFAFARLLTDGSLDTSFHSDGITSMANGTTDNGALAVAIDSEGRIIGAGTSFNGGNWDFAVTALATDGSLDTSFKTNGKYTGDYNNGLDVGYGVGIGGSNKIILAGSFYNGTNMDLGFIRLYSDGVLDTSFDSDGKKVVDIGTNDDGANGVQLQTDGNVIVASGYTYGTNNDNAVIRLKIDGSLDSSFATNGKYTKAIGSAEDTAQGMYMAGNGIIYVVGRTDTGGAAFDYTLVRLQSNGGLAQAGAPVLSLGSGGKRTFGINGTDLAYTITVDTSAKFILSGASGSNTNDFAIVRMNINGSLDTTFHTDGIQETNLAGTDKAWWVTVQTDGKLVQCGQGNSNFALVRYESNGVLDTSFATDGSYGGTAGFCVFVAQTSDQKLAWVADTGATMWVARSNADGSLDTSFNTTGERGLDGCSGVDTSITGALDTADRLYGECNGSGLTPGVSNTFRFTIDGRIDTTFSSDGAVQGYLASEGNSIAITREGKLYQTGSNEDSLLELIMYRSLSTGGVDTTFHSDGSANPFASQSIVHGLQISERDESLVVYDDSVDFVFARFTSEGRLDTTFSSDGKTAVAFAGTDTPTSLAIHPNGWTCALGRDNGVDFGVACVWQ